MRMRSLGLGQGLISQVPNEFYFVLGLRNIFTAKDTREHAQIARRLSRGRGELRCSRSLLGVVL